MGTITHVQFFGIQNFCRMLNSGYIQKYPAAPSACLRLAVPRRLLCSFFILNMPGAVQLLAFSHMKFVDQSCERFNVVRNLLSYTAEYEQANSN